MKLIPLGGRYGKGRFAQVDDEDYEEINKYRWYAGYYKSSNSIRAARNYKGPDGKITIRLMQFFIMGSKPGLVLDHIDGDPLNNQRHNLRFCTIQENNTNRRKNRNGKSKYLGVFPGKSRGGKFHWEAKIRKNGEIKFLGCFPFTEDGELAAHQAYELAAKNLFGEFKREKPEKLTIEVVESKREAVVIPNLPDGVSGIPLHSGQYAIVDSQDYENLMKYKWSLYCGGGLFSVYGYVTGENGQKNKFISMHRFLLDAPKGSRVEHIDGDQLNNTRSNLRFYTPVKKSKKQTL